MNPLLNFTVVGYQYVHEWEQFANCLLLQTDERWTCDFINDGPDDIAKRICMKYAEAYPDKFRYLYTENRFNDWGHSLRALGLEQTTTPYWSTQNADNYLMPVFVEYTLRELQRRDLDMVIFPCVHNYPNVNPPKSPPYAVLNVAPKATRCDAGSLVIKTDLAKSVGWNHRFNEADGAFIDEVAARRPKIATLPNILMVHN